MARRGLIGVLGVLVWVVGVVLSCGVFGGCAAYITYPASEAGEDGLRGDVNTLPSPRLQRLAVGRVLSLDRASGAWDGGAWVLNPTGGLRLARAEDLRRRLVELHPGGLLVGEPGYESAPVYSVTRVWVRGDEGRVDVVRPAAGAAAGAAGGDSERFSRVTVHFRSWGGSWRVEEVFAWASGLAEEPTLFSWPGLGVEGDGGGSGSGAGGVGSGGSVPSDDGGSGGGGSEEMG